MKLLSRNICTIIGISVFVFFGTACIRQQTTPTALLIIKADGYFQSQQYMAPKDENAYDLYRKALLSEPSNEYALKKIYLISEIILEKLDHINREEYARLIERESAGEDIKEEMISVLSQMIGLSEDGKKICEEHPKRDSELCAKFGVALEYYNKRLSYYKQSESK